MPDDPAATDLLSALEREVQGLRTAQAEADRERAAIVLKCAAIDAERASWLQERDQLVAECRRLEMQSAPGAHAARAGGRGRRAGAPHVTSASISSSSRGGRAAPPLGQARAPLKARPPASSRGLRKRRSSASMRSRNSRSTSVRRSPCW